jgi:hypothetical protein
MRKQKTESTSRYIQYAMFIVPHSIDDCRRLLESHWKEPGWWSQAGFRVTLYHRDKERHIYSVWKQIQDKQHATIYVLLEPQSDNTLLVQLRAFSATWDERLMVWFGIIFAGIIPLIVTVAILSGVISIQSLLCLAGIWVVYLSVVISTKDQKIDDERQLAREVQAILTQSIVGDKGKLE